VGRETTLLAARAFLVSSGALVDTCTIEHRTGEVTIGMQVTPTYATVYSGACRVQAAAANWAGPTDVAEAALRLASFELQLPVIGSEGIEIDDRVTILTCLNDADLVGRKFTITGVSRKSHATTRKLPLLEVLS
jgi:Family of unknown function (DUF6093)